jgi:glycosyltransferase involved in cell wall biosynthesis
MVNISLIVHSKNAEKLLPALIASTEWIDDRMLVDMQSSDQSVALAERHCFRIETVENHPRVDGVRNKFIDKAKYEWVLVLDSDEFLPDDAEYLIPKLLEKYKDQIDAFAIPRFNFIAGTIMKATGWYPDHQIRLFKKGVVSWSDYNHVPPAVKDPGKLLFLQPPCLHIHHYNYDNITDVITRQLHYAINQNYDFDFNFMEYVQKSYQNLATRNSPEHDGQLSTVLSVIMAWDAIIQGLIHWDRLDPKPDINALLAAPLYSENRSSTLQKEVDRLSTINLQQQEQINTFLRCVPIRASRLLGSTFPTLKNLLKKVLMK